MRSNFLFGILPIPKILFNLLYIKDKLKCKFVTGTCFTGDTLVYTKEGYLSIKNIQAGDDIYSREEKTGETGFQKVEEVFRRAVHTIYTIEVNTTTKIHTTSRHPFYVEGEGWIIAKQLQVGMNLQTFNGTAVITDLRKERTEEEIPVYNFRVSEWSSYFVSEWNVYVHNADEIEYTSSKKKDKPKIEGKSGTLDNYIKYTDEMKIYIHPPENGYDAFLEKKYIEIRKKGLDDISIVAQNTGLTEQEIIDLKRHVFLDTHELSFDGGAYQTSYFTADPDIAYAWEAATNEELSEEQKAWFRQMANHELGEKTLMDQGMPLRDLTTYQEGYGFKVDPTKNAHDAAPKQPKVFPGSTQSKDFMKYFDKDPEDY